jgi:hypothetical protein
LSQTPEENQVLNEKIKLFLRYLSPYFLQVAAFHVLEWMVRRFLVHEMNVDEVLECILPFHDTSQFARVVLILALRYVAFYLVLAPLGFC